MTEDDVEALARGLLESSGRNPDAYPRHGEHWCNAFRTANVALIILEARGWQSPDNADGADDAYDRDLRHAANAHSKNTDGQ